MENAETVMRSVQITKTGAGFIGISCIMIFYLSYNYGSSIWLSYAQTVDIQHLLAVSAQLAKLAGDRAWSIHKEHHTDMEMVVKGKTKEGADEMLTRGDMESHRIMRFGLEKTFPGLKVMYSFHCISTDDGLILYTQAKTAGQLSHGGSTPPGLPTAKMT